MKSLTRHGAVAASLVLVPAALVGQELYFQPKDGASLERTFTLELDLDLADADVTQMGEPVDPSEMFDGDTAIETKVEATIGDAVEKAVRGRVDKLVRTYGDFLVDGEAPEDFEERRVEFTWDAERGEHTLRLLDVDEPDADDEEFLMTVAEDLDHRAFLPEGEVEPDATWQVELGGAGLGDLVMPFMKFEGLEDLALSQAGDEDPEASEAVETVMDAVEEALAGVVLEVTYLGVAEDEGSGRRVGRCKIAIDFDTSVDLGQLLTDLAARQADRSGDESPTPTIELDVTLALEGEGEFTWDLEGHHMNSMSLPLDVEIGATGRLAIEIEGLGELEFIAGSITYGGTAELTQKVTAR
ncbi:MAG: hypothetical protein R3F34_00065 [Planctomycetota bacterium]